MKNKKVLTILNRFNVGGPIYNVIFLTNYLNKNNFETLLIGGKCESYEQSSKYILDKENIKFTELKHMKRAISPFHDFISLIEIILVLYKFKPYIIHTHAAKAGLLGRIACIFYFNKKKIIHTYHGNVFEGYFSNFKNKIILFVERLLSKKTDKIIALSNLQKNDLVNKYFISKEDKIEVIPLGLDLKKFSNNLVQKRQKKRTEFEISNDQVLISIIGRLVPIKNHKFFIDVINFCRKKTDFKLKALIIGDGPEINNLINYAKSLGLKYNYKEMINKDYDIFFCSWKEDIDSFLAASDILTLTSINEGTPVSIIEAMVSGTACVSTDVGGVSDIIENNKSGIVSNANVSEFSKCLLKLINDENYRNKMGLNAKKRSLELFDYKVLSQSVKKLYQ